jgi:hypothetical protein
MPPPSGRRRNWVHWGVMIPGLPEPHRFFTVMAIAGTPGVRLFANDHLVTTSPADTAYLVSATSAMTGGQFRAYAIGAECEFAADGSRLRFGDDLLITGRLPRLALHRRHPEAEVALDLDVSDVTTHFVRLPGVYRHWSRLARAWGRVGDVQIDTPCTVEYAAGVGLHSLLDRRLPGRLTLPSRFFTYHVLNLDDETQLLFTYVLGPAGIPVQKAVHVRSLRTGAMSYRRGHSFVVHEYEPQPRRTPDGRSMRLPLRFTWRVDADGRPIEVQGKTNGDFAYGLGAGYVGTYDYDATFRGRTISGRAYLEFIDCR